MMKRLVVVALMAVAVPSALRGDELDPLPDDSDYMDEADFDAEPGDGHKRLNRKGQYGAEIDWYGVYLTAGENQRFGTGLAIGGGLVYFPIDALSIHVRYGSSDHKTFRKDSTDHLRKFRTDLGFRYHPAARHFDLLFGEIAVGRLRTVLVKDDAGGDVAAVSPLYGAGLGVKSDFSPEFTGTLGVRYIASTRKELSPEYQGVDGISHPLVEIAVGTQFFVP